MIYDYNKYIGAKVLNYDAYGFIYGGYKDDRNYRCDGRRGSCSEG